MNQYYFKPATEYLVEKLDRSTTQYENLMEIPIASRTQKNKQQILNLVRQMIDDHDLLTKLAYTEGDDEDRYWAEHISYFIEDLKEKFNEF